MPFKQHLSSQKQNEGPLLPTYVSEKTWRKATRWLQEQYRKKAK